MTLKLIERIQCQREDGSPAEVQIYQDFGPAGTMGNPQAQVAGMKECRLSDGTPVNYVDAQTFKVFDTGQLLKRT